jgi:4-oxalocrotonate tautomerase
MMNRSLGLQQDIVKRCYTRSRSLTRVLAAMPFVAVHIARGRPPEKRRRIAEAITEVLSEILEIDRRETQVLIQEHDRDNWAVGGELLSERQPATTDLPDLEALFRKPAERRVEKPPAKPSKAASQKPKAKPRSRR